ncbi:sterol 3-beta-glucosyltransferase [Paenibacillus swuensis]|uniref:Sterol 3-beta-glucosyltransferase n=1 Tax=Paenibacillus swuensis TaxID=1178515 RepID=A0A172TJM0_9BACL|nr:glycosyltransferase [Paenibacillus swuensis]ANE47228.1 sterol 3-beta-glucosyltransferase [Paenibacillus swuensis]
MLITMLTTGTRGDTQPYIALGLALQKRGHRVRIAASESFRDFVKHYGLEYAPIRGDITKIAQSELAQDAGKADNPLKFYKSLKKDEFKRLFLDMQQDMYQACLGADAVVYHPGATLGYFAAQERHIPSILATPFPMTPTSAYPNLLFYNRPSFGKLYNKLTHRIFEMGFWMISGDHVKQFWKEQFGTAPRPFSSPFPRQRTATHPTLISLSPSVFPRPDDWSEHIHCDGYWFLEPDKSYSPPQELQDFLNAGKPPIYVGFGSISGQAQASETTAIVIEALKRNGQRGIIAKGWGGMERPDELDKDILFIDGAPHDWLFPRMAAVVHHGGAGTTAEGLRSGVPSLIIPFTNDQFAWGQRVHELGVGPKAIPRKQLTTENLTQAMKYTQINEVKAKAQVLGSRIRSERGAEASAQAVIDCIEAYQKKGK